MKPRERQFARNAVEAAPSRLPKRHHIFNAGIPSDNDKFVDCPGHGYK